MPVILVVYISILNFIFLWFRLWTLREERENYQEKIDEKDSGRSATKIIIMVSMGLSWNRGFNRGGVALSTCCKK